MDDAIAKSIENKKRTFMSHLQKIEIWLLDVMKSPEVREENKNSHDIQDNCNYVFENFKDILSKDMTIEQQIMIVIPMLNALIRVYAIDKSGIITSQKYFQLILTGFTDALVRIRDDILNYNESSTMITSSSHSIKFLTDILRQEYITNILDSLLTNFAKHDLLKNCCELFFSNQTTLSTDSNTANDQCSQNDPTGSEALEKIMGCTEDFARETIIRLVDEFAKKYQYLMIVFREFIDDFFKDINNHSVHSSRMEIVDHFFNMAWNWTDNVLLVPIFLKAGYAEVAVEWIRKLSAVSIRKKFDEAVIAIVYNLSRHEDGLRTLRQNHAFEILMEYQKSTNFETAEKRDEMTRLLGITLIGLATNDDQKQNQELIRKLTEDLYDMCQEAVNYRDLRSKGYHLSDILVTIECIFANISIVRHVLGNELNVKTERIKFFAELFTSSYGLSINQEIDYLEKIIWKSLLNILLCISNYIEYRKILRENDEFCTLIEGLSKRPKQDIAKRIWSNLQLDKYSSILSHQQKTKQHPMIYINYNRTDENFCKSFIKKLRMSSKIRIWVDYENVGWSDDPWDSVAPIIQHVTTVVVLVSNAYCDSIVNFHELTYALTLAKIQPQSETISFIFVEAEKDIAGKREWISDLSKERTVDYNDNMDRMVYAMLKHDTFLKKYTLITSSSRITAQSHICTIL